MKYEKKKKLKKIKIIQSPSQLKKKFKSNTEKKILINILNSCKNYVYSYPAYNYRSNSISAKETINMFTFINNYFYGSCHEITFYVKYALSLNNIKSKIIHMSNTNGLSHLALEVDINKNLYFVDPTFGYFFYKKKNKILSLKKIKELIISKEIFYCNKKISLNKFKNLNPKNYFYYKKKKNFKNAKVKYLSLFKKVEFMELKKNDYTYKKELRKNLNISDYYQFKPIKYDFKLLKSIKVISNGDGIIEKKLIKTNNIIKFNNYVLKFENKSKVIKIKNFPFNILNIKIFTNTKDSIKLTVIMNNLKKIINVKNDIYIFDKFKNIYNKPIKNLEIRSSNCIYNYEIKTIKTFFNYENCN